MKKFHWLILTSIMFLVISCEIKYPVIIHRLNDNDRQMILYSIGDTVRFFNKKGMPITLYADKTFSWINEVEDGVSYEGEGIRLLSGDSTYILRVTVHSSTLEIDFMDAPTYLGVGFIYDSYGNFLYVANFDSVCIGNHIYRNVVRSEMHNTLLGIPAGMEIRQIYYSKTHGVLQVINNIVHGVPQVIDKTDTVFTLDTVIFAKKR